MCCSTLLGFVLGVIIFKVVRRIRAVFCQGPAGCGGHRGCHAYGYRYAGSRPDEDQPLGRSSLSIDALLPGLELNERQQVEAAPIFALLSERLGARGPRLEVALSILAKERFDASPLLAELGGLSPGEQHRILDGVEHLHTILIAEQREYLSKQLQRR